MAELGQIASLIYNGNPSFGAYQRKTGLTYISGTATSLGLSEPSFSLWSGEEESNYHAYYRYFSSTYSAWNGNYGNSRKDSGAQAVCIAD